MSYGNLGSHVIMMIKIVGQVGVHHTEKEHLQFSGLTALCAVSDQCPPSDRMTHCLRCILHRVSNDLFGKLTWIPHVGKNVTRMQMMAANLISKLFFCFAQSWRQVSCCEDNQCDCMDQGCFI